MIRKLIIKNFESHKNTIVEFSDGFNVVQGISNSGKSSIVRVIRLLAYGEWDKEYVRKGAKVSVVTCITDKGEVLVKRGNKVNYWKILLDGKKYIYRNVGKDVPEEAEQVIGFGKVKVGGIPVSLNVGSQLEKHFLISEVDGKKLSQSVAARMIDDLGGIRRVEELFDSLQKDRKSSQKEIKKEKLNIDEFKDKLYDESELDGVEREVESVEKVIKEYDSVSERIKQVEEFKKKVEEFYKRMEKFKKENKYLEQIESVKKTFDAVKLSKDEFDKAQRVLDGKKQWIITTDNAGESMKEIDEKLERVRREFSEKLGEMNVCPLSDGELYNSCKELLNAR